MNAQDMQDAIDHRTDGNVSVTGMICRALRLLERYPDKRAEVEEGLFSAIREHAPRVDRLLDDVVIDGRGS